MGYYLTRPQVPRARRLAVAAGLFLVAVGLHFGQNADPIQQALASRFGGVDVWGGFLFVLTAALLVGLYWRAVRTERQQLRHAATVTGLLTQSELQTLTSRRARRHARRRAHAAHGPDGERLVAELQHTQLGLAARLVRGTDHDGPSLQRLHRNALALRQQLGTDTGQHHDPATAPDSAGGSASHRDPGD